MSLRKQGANKGATTAFMISTPESGVDSIAISFALLDPIMAIARPVVAFFTATFAGIWDNITTKKEEVLLSASPDASCPVDGCCDGINCPPDRHANHHSFAAKVKAGIKYALMELWGDMAVWFLIGVILAGVITSIFPEEVMGRYLGGGLKSMLIMLVVGIPLYICATASTPIAAALILKGVSPGAALVFLLAGPATNITSLTVLLGILGKKSTVVYLTSIAVFSVLAGLLLDKVYQISGISAQATIGEAAELIPGSIEFFSACIVLLLSIKPVFMSLKQRAVKVKREVV